LKPDLACTADSVCRPRQISWIRRFRVFQPCLRNSSSLPNGVLRHSTSGRPVWPHFPQLARKSQTVLARIGHCWAYELVRVWECPPLSHLLSASARLSTALLCNSAWSLRKAEPSWRPRGRPGQRWPHFTHLAQRPQRVLSLTCWSEHLKRQCTPQTPHCGGRRENHKTVMLALLGGLNCPRRRYTGIRPPGVAFDQSRGTTADFRLAGRREQTQLPWRPSFVFRRLASRSGHLNPYLGGPLRQASTLWRPAFGGIAPTFVPFGR
jgi:hypothetical protein